MEDLYDRLYEKLAAIEHERWSDWMRYQFTLCKENKNGSLTIPLKLVERWKAQIDTNYTDLSEREKDSDREQVDRYWNLICAYVEGLDV